MRPIQYISTICLILFGLNTHAQNNFKTAYAFYKAEQYDSASVYIDKCIESGERNAPQTWQLRGVIYRKLDVSGSTVNRVIAMESFLESKKLDTSASNIKKSNGYLYQVNLSYYNDAVGYIDAGKLNKAEESYITYKKNFDVYLNMTKNFHKKDIEFYAVLGGAWFNQDNQTTPAQKDLIYDKAIFYFEKVLELDSMNFMANKGIGIVYYNQGASLIENMNPFTSDLFEIDRIQNISISMFKKGEPYLLKAYGMNTKDKDIVEGLAGINYSLNKTVKFKYYKELLEGLRHP